MSRAHHVVDLTGQTFAGATVISRADNNSAGSVTWHCRLECGHTKTISGCHLRTQERRGGRIRCTEGCSTNQRRSLKA
jgi:hypothetical protein